MRKVKLSFNKIQRYALSYYKYDLEVKDYVRFVEYIESCDIYHDIGKKVCTTFEPPIIRVEFFDLRIFSFSTIETILQEKGYKKIRNFLWCKYEK